VTCYRPLVQSGQRRPGNALPLAGRDDLWFTHVEAMDRSGYEILSVDELPASRLERLTAPRDPVVGLDMGVPQIMGILNVTPDSFSDGGKHSGLAPATEAAVRMVSEGAAIIDIGGESTRPGAEYVGIDTEIDRTAPVIAAIRERSDVPVSIDTRKAPVAQAALAAGAGLVNDVSGFCHDAQLAPVSAAAQVPVCVMHAQGDPKTMQDDPQYDDVLLDVFDFLESRIRVLEEAGIPRSRIITDPGIGFGKTLDHNLTILQNISLFHDLGCAILLGASRKRFIGTIGREPQAAARAPGSVAVGLAALAQGVQILRVHDVAETVQAVRLWQATR
jgi:dihydropteroate synthase